jgi:hypothetical protein
VAAGEEREQKRWGEVSSGVLLLTTVVIANTIILYIV